MYSKMFKKVMKSFDHTSSLYNTLIIKTNKKELIKHENYKYNKNIIS